MTEPLEHTDRAVNPVMGVILIVGIAVVCSAALGTFLIGVGGDLEGSTPPGGTLEVNTLVQDETDGFVTLEVTTITDADLLEVTATTTDGSAAIADGTGGTAELTERRESPGDSITFRKAVDDPRDVELRLVAVAHGDGETVVFDRTVIV